MASVAVYLIKAVTIFLTLMAASISLIAAYRRLQTERKRRAVVDSELSERFLKQFNDKEIAKSLSGYIVPHCSPGDPANKDGEEFLADTRESIFSYMDRNIENVARSYHLILADTGMGKTTFCLNYFAHSRKRFADLNVCVVSLAGNGYEAIIRTIVNKSDTILIADAFDEDPKAWGRGRERMGELLLMAADFKMVIVTCRSQYFASDDSIPRETPLPVIVPRQIGQSPTFSLIRSYISPFSKQEISRYINKHFPLLYFWRRASRKRAMELVATVPDLAHRPMLLERLPELARKPAKSKELYDLYDLLVDGWLMRESRWIAADKLSSVSTELALQMHSSFGEKSGRMTPDEIEYIARTRIGESPDWGHLTSRSLLNRDSRGNYKFAHKSIMEFLIVRSACQGDDRALATEWTPFMKEVFVSWGYSDAGKGKWARGRAIMGSDQGRKNIAPLFDMQRSSSVRGIPDFKTCAERRKTVTGERLAPSSWRASSIDVHGGVSRGSIAIHETEFNLRWYYLPREALDSDMTPVKLYQVLQYMNVQPQYKLPSLEQLLTLIEGLYRAKKSILPRGRLFLIEDKPARHEHILIQLNHKPMEHNRLFKCIDKNRRLADTDVYINSYLTGLRFSSSYAQDIAVEQLYLEDANGDMFGEGDLGPVGPVRLAALQSRRSKSRGMRDS